MSTNSDNVRAFTFDLGKFSKGVEKRVAIIVQFFALDIFSRLTLRTPVDTGRARASWDIATADASEYVPEEGNYSGPKDVSAAAASIDGKKLVFITSGLHYMQYLEEGSSQQAPAGMIDITVAEIEIEAEAIFAQFAA